MGVVGSIFWVRGGEWTIFMGRLGWVGVVGGKFWLGGRWVDIFYWWVGVHRDDLGWSLVLI